MSWKNEVIGVMFDTFKQTMKQMCDKFEDYRIEHDEERVFQFVNGVLDYEQFKLNISIPSDLQDKNDCLGTYISINIPQLTNTSGILFIPIENNIFKIQLTGGSGISILEEIPHNVEIDFNACLEIGNKIIKLFYNTYVKRQKLIEKIIKNYFYIQDDINFSEVNVDFFSPVTEGRNKYLYCYDNEKNIVFLNDVFKTNYKSVINGIEEIATEIVNKEKIKDLDSIKWKNIFININNSGIIIQDIKIKPKYQITKPPSFISKFFSKKEPENIFIGYREGADFNTDYHVPFNEVSKIWKELDIEGLKND